MHIPAAGSQNLNCPGLLLSSPRPARTLNVTSFPRLAMVPRPSNCGAVSVRDNPVPENDPRKVRRLQLCGNSGACPFSAIAISNLGYLDLTNHSYRRSKRRSSSAASRNSTNFGADLLGMAYAGKMLTAVSSHIRGNFWTRQA